MPIPRVTTNGGEGPKGRRHCWALQDDSPMHSSPQWEDKEAEPPFLEFDLGPPLELGPDVECFFRQLANESREDEENNFSSEPPAEEYERWVEWRG